MAENTKRRNVSLPIPDDIFLHDMAEANSVSYSRVISMIVFDWLQEQRFMEKQDKKPSILYTRYQEWAEENKPDAEPLAEDTA
jgi:hypothetical protein